MSDFFDPNLTCRQICNRNIAVRIRGVGARNQFSTVLITVDAELPSSKVLAILGCLLKT